MSEALFTLDMEVDGAPHKVDYALLFGLVILFTIVIPITLLVLAYRFGSKDADGE